MAQAQASESEAFAQQATAVAETNFRATAKAAAITQRNFAEEQTRLITSHELALAALNNLDHDPELSILLTLEALKVAHTYDHPASGDERVGLGLVWEKRPFSLQLGWKRPFPLYHGHA